MGKNSKRKQKKLEETESFIETQNETVNDQPVELCEKTEQDRVNSPADYLNGNEEEKEKQKQDNKRLEPKPKKPLFTHGEGKPVQYQLETVKYLIENDLPTLKEEFKISYKRHSTHPNLVLLKYHQIRSPFSSEIVKECRGLILDEENDYAVVCYPYKKFFNYGEKHAANIDWESASVYEKVDGSLATIYFYKDQWWVSSSGSPDATGNVGGGDPAGIKFVSVTPKTEVESNDWNFSKLFWDIWKNEKYQLPSDQTKCYIFEMFTDRNRIIVSPEKDTLVLHGVRDLNTLQEFLPEPFAEKYKWVCAKRYNLHSIEEVLKASKALKFNQSEGFVVVDIDFNRIKIKAEQYVAVSHLSMKDNQKKNVSSLLNVIKQNEGDEFLAYFPACTDLYLLLKQKYNEFIEKVQETYQKLKQKQESLKWGPKEMKKEMYAYPYGKCLEALISQQVESAWDFFAQESDKTLEAYLDLKSIYLEGQNRFRRTEKEFTIEEPGTSDDFAEHLEKEMKYQKEKELELELKKREQIKTHQDTAWNKKNPLINTIHEEQQRKSKSQTQLKKEEGRPQDRENQTQKEKGKQRGRNVMTGQSVTENGDRNAGNNGWIVVQNRKGKKK